MATITLKNVPDDLHRRLKARAAQNGRSLNREAIRCLDEGTRAPNSDALLEEAAAFRAKLAAKGVWITDADIEDAIEQGRP